MLAVLPAIRPLLVNLVCAYPSDHGLWMTVYNHHRLTDRMNETEYSIRRETNDMNLPIVAENMTIPRTFMPSLVPGSVLKTTSGGGVRSREKL